MQHTRGVDVGPLQMDGTLLAFLIRHGRHLCSQSQALQLQPQPLPLLPPAHPLPSPAPPVFPSTQDYPLLPLSLAAPQPQPQPQRQQQQPCPPSYPAALQRLAGALQACEALLSQ